MNRRKVLISALLLVTWLCVTAQNRTSQSNGTSGYWELVKTNIIQHEDTHNENGSYTLYTASATEHTKQGKAWGIVGPLRERDDGRLPTAQESVPAPHEPRHHSQHCPQDTQRI